MNNNDIILKTVDLCKLFSVGTDAHIFSRSPKTTFVKALNAVSIDVRKGEISAIVGESGSGKTTFAYMVTRVFEPTSGKIYLDGNDITHIKGHALKEIRKKIQMVFQDPGTSLNPRQTIESIVSLPLKMYSNLTRYEIRSKVAELLASVELPAEIMKRYPGALSGGQKQRVSLARALALNPKYLVMDEPTSALDVSVQAKILDMMMKLKNHYGLTYILITHDVNIVRNISDRIAVMYLGRLVELAKTADLFQHPAHPYTKALLSAVPVVTEQEKAVLPKEIILEGEIPSPENIPATCPFLSRCQERLSICEKPTCPDLTKIGKDHFVRCFLHGSTY